VLAEGVGEAAERVRVGGHGDDAHTNGRFAYLPGSSCVPPRYPSFAALAWVVVV